MASRLAILALILATPLAAVAQSPLVETGARVRVHSRGAGPQRHIGTIVEFRADSIVIDQGGDTTVVARSDVSQLEISQGMQSHLSRDATIGAGIGLALGALYGILTYEECVSDALLGCMFAPDDEAESALIAGAIGSLVGSAIGAIVGSSHRSDRWTRVDAPLRATIAPSTSGGVRVAVTRVF